MCIIYTVVAPILGFSIHLLSFDSQRRARIFKRVTAREREMIEIKIEIEIQIKIEIEERREGARERKGRVGKNKFEFLN